MEETNECRVTWVGRGCGLRVNFLSPLLKSSLLTSLRAVCGRPWGRCPRREWALPRPSPGSTCAAPASLPRAVRSCTLRPGGALPTISPLGWPGPALQPCVSLGLESLSRWGRASCLRSVPRGLYCLARGCPHADSGGPPWSQRAGRACHQRPLWRGAAEPQACAACGMKAGDSRGRSEGAQLGLVGGGQWRPGAQHGHPTGLWDGCPAELPA